MKCLKDHSTSSQNLRFRNVFFYVNDESISVDKNFSCFSTTSCRKKSPNKFTLKAAIEKLNEIRLSKWETQESMSIRVMGHYAMDPSLIRRRPFFEVCIKYQFLYMFWTFEKCNNILGGIGRSSSNHVSRVQGINKKQFF